MRWLVPATTARNYGDLQFAHLLRICTNHDLVPRKSHRTGAQHSESFDHLLHSILRAVQKLLHLMSPLFLSQSQFDFIACPLPIWKRTFAGITLVHQLFFGVSSRGGLGGAELIAVVEKRGRAEVGGHAFLPQTIRSAPNRD